MLPNRCGLRAAAHVAQGARPPIARLAVAMVAAVGLASPHGQQPTEQKPPTFRTGTNLIRVDATVIDSRGNPVTSLTAEDFEVRENGVPQAITSFGILGPSSGRGGAGEGGGRGRRGDSACGHRAFAALTPRTARNPIDFWAGTRRLAGGRMEVALAWTPRDVKVDERLVPADVFATATSSGGGVSFEGTIEPAGTFFEAPHGPLELAIAVRASSGETIDRDKRTLDVPAPDARTLAISTPVVLRIRSAAEVRALAAAARAPIHAGRDFERIDRLFVRFVVSPSPAATPLVTARLLDVRGSTLTQLPVQEQPAAGTYQIDLPLTTIARGEYALAVTAGAGDEQADAVVAFRVVR